MALSLPFSTEPTNYRDTLAKMLASNALDTSPVGSWTQGAARMAQALLLALDDRKHEADSKDASAWTSGTVAALGAAPGGFSAAPATPGASADAGGSAGAPSPDAGAAPGYGSATREKIAAMMTDAANARGVDPNKALRVYAQEGGSNYVGDEGSSFGPLQLHMGGISKKYPNPGMGDDFKRVTGLDPRDPSTIKDQINFGLDQAVKGGWGPWSSQAGRPRWEGIGDYAARAGGPGAAAAPPAAAAPLSVAQITAPLNSAPPAAAAYAPANQSASLVPMGGSALPPSAAPKTIGGVPIPTGPATASAAPPPAAAPAPAPMDMAAAQPPPPPARPVDLGNSYPSPADLARIGPGIGTFAQDFGPGRAPAPTAPMGGAPPPAAGAPPAMGGTAAPPAGLTPAASQPINPQIRAMIMQGLQSPNPQIRAQAQALAGAIVQQQIAPPHYSFQVVGDRLYRTDDRGGYSVAGEVSKPEYRVIGKDEFGQEKYGWVNPQGQAVTPGPKLESTPAGSSTVPPAPAGVDPKVWREQWSKRKTEEGMPASDEMESKLRNEIQTLPSYKNLAQAAPVYKSMLEAGGRDNRAADVNLIYGMAKIMDPNSVVREGEMTIAQAVATLPEQLRAQISSQFSGSGRLPPDVRQAIIQEARGRLAAYQGMFDQDMTMYSGIAERGRMNKQNVIPTFGPYPEYKPPSEPVVIDDYKIRQK